MPLLERKEDDKYELLQFIFNSHLSLFNTRRDHEWRVIISAMILMGAVDATLLSQKVTLTDRQEDVWWFALLLLFLSIGWYQWGVQVRNRVDRVAMDHVLSEICDAIDIKDKSPIRAGIDREDERISGGQVDIIMHHTYLWAFLPQMLVLLISCMLSGYLPQLINELSTKSEPATTTILYVVS
jgi:hypothetical protein